MPSGGPLRGFSTLVEFTGVVQNISVSMDADLIAIGLGYIISINDQAFICPPNPSPGQAEWIPIIHAFATTSFAHKIPLTVHAYVSNLGGPNVISSVSF
jgi:hypothetical protein